LSLIYCDIQQALPLTLKKKTALRHVNSISEEELTSKNHSHSAVSFSPFNE
jgi:hypothetical protein